MSVSNNSLDEILIKSENNNFINNILEKVSKNKKVVIIVVVVLLASGYYLYNKNKNKKIQQSEETKTNDLEEIPNKELVNIPNHELEELQRQLLEQQLFTQKLYQHQQSIEKRLSKPQIYHTNNQEMETNLSNDNTQVKQYDLSNSEIAEIHKKLEQFE